MNKPTTSHLEDHLGYHLRVISNAVSQSFSKKLATHNVNIAEWVILREMYSEESGTSPSQLSRQTGLTRGAVSKIIDSLLNKGFVIRATSVDDRRYQDIHLTTAGNELVPELASIADENDAHFFAFLLGEEQAALKATLIKLAEFHQLKTTPIK